MEIKTSALGTLFSIIGFLNLLVAGLGVLMMFQDSESQGIILAISGASAAPICFAIATALHFLAEIAQRLEMIHDSNEAIMRKLFPKKEEA